MASSPRTTATGSRSRCSAASSAATTRLDAAEAQVVADGLASLADRWTWSDRSTQESSIVCIIEANADEVTVAHGFYASADAPRSTVTRQQLESGAIRLTR